MKQKGVSNQRIIKKNERGMKEERIKGKGIRKIKGEWGWKKWEISKTGEGEEIENKGKKTQMVGKEEENKERGFY